VRKVFRKKQKVQVKFDPRVPLYFTAYVDNSKESRFFVTAVKRTLLPYGIDLKIKPLQPGAPTPAPALFVQDKYFFCYASRFRPSELDQFVSRARAVISNLTSEWVAENEGKFVVAVRPMYSRDSRRYLGRYHILSPSDVRLGFMTFESDFPGDAVTPYLLEGLDKIGVRYMVFPSSHEASTVRIYTGDIRVQED